jgi:hypothetical protein
MYLGTTGQGCTATVVQKWTSLKTNDTYFAFYCTVQRFFHENFLRRTILCLNGVFICQPFLVEFPFSGFKPAVVQCEEMLLAPDIPYNCVWMVFDMEILLQCSWTMSDRKCYYKRLNSFLWQAINIDKTWGSFRAIIDFIFLLVGNGGRHVESSISLKNWRGNN